jgi:polysaccharide export outer membrane protein
MRHKDVNVRSVPLDSAVRKYDVPVFDYRIQPHDVLSVQFISPTENEFNFLREETMGAAQMQMLMLMGEMVDENGEIAYPVIGRVKVAGLTVFEVENKLQQLANNYLDPVKVRVRMLNFRVTVLGEVVREGSVSSFNNRVTLLEVLALAGGVGEFANRKQVKIVRQFGNQTEVAYVNLLDERLMESPYYYVHQNDIVVVPPLRQRPFRRHFAQNISIILSIASIALITWRLLLNP